MREKFSVLLCSLLIIAASTFSHDAHAKRRAKEWTFLVYLNGNNNLDSFGPLNINQMEKVGSSSNINIIVQWASQSSGKVQRLYIKHDWFNSKKVISPVIQDMGKVDMGDWKSLSEFIQWGAENYPAKHYLVDVWDHGSGWHALQMQSQMRAMSLGAGNPGTIFHPTDISWDDISGNHITTKQLGMALNDASRAIGRKIDIYGSDACLMASAEVAAEMKDSVDYYVGSQDLEPGAGWPYDQILKRWSRQAKKLNPRGVAQLIAEEYTKSYQGGSNGTQEVTASAFDMSHFAEFEDSIRNLGTELSKLGPDARGKVLQAASDSPYFTYDDYHDLIDFVSRVDGLKVASDRGIFSQVKDAASKLLIVNTVTSSWSGKANGITFWMPGNRDSYAQYLDLYRDLAFEHDTDWSKALDTLLPAAAPPAPPETTPVDPGTPANPPENPAPAPVTPAPVTAPAIL